jgi:hypothetical protein
MDDGLPHPGEALTLADIEDQHERVLDMLEQGGAVIVYSNDRQMRLGVLTRDPALLGDAQVAQLIDAGHPPPNRRAARHERPWRVALHENALTPRVSRHAIRTLTVAEIQPDWEGALEELKQGRRDPRRVRSRRGVARRADARHPDHAGQKSRS